MLLCVQISSGVVPETYRTNVLAHDIDTTVEKTRQGIYYMRDCYVHYHEELVSGGN